ncbi:MAG: protein translocase subunit SecF [Chloroflexota bacterium]
MFNIVQRRKWFFIFSGLVILAGVIAMGISIATYPEHSPVRLSIDFIGGSLLELEFKPLPGTTPSGQITEEMLTSTLTQFGLRDIRIQRVSEVGVTGTNRWQIRSNYVDNDTTNMLKAGLDAMAKPLSLQLDQDTLRTNQVTPTVGSEVTRAALVATIAASIAVLGWIVYSFRGIAGSFRYGVCAVLAMLHDILVMVGIMSIMGLVFKWEADSLFLTGLLTVVGYSVQDTIVVFDRIRENSAKHRGEPYEMIINRSIMETIQRSLALQLVVAFVLVALFLMGGDSIRQFVGVLLIGLLSGTYSSTFVAVPLLVAWDEGQLPFVNRAVARA